MMRSVGIFLMVSLSALYAQDHTHAWSAQDPNCKRYLLNGSAVKSIDAGGLHVEASIRDTGWKTRADLLIVNQSGQSVDVHPEQFKLIDIANGKELKYNEPDSMARAIRRRTGLFAAMTTMGAAMQTRTTTAQTTETATVTATGPGGVATGTYGGTSTTATTTPDYEAQQRAANQVNQMNANARGVVASIQSVALRANTIFPSNQISGVVYFDRTSKHDNDYVLTVVVGSEVFQLPFSRPASK